MSDGNYDGIVYFGNNSFVDHKRGVENVIEFQSRSHNYRIIFYVHWGPVTKAYKHGNFSCISIKHCWYWPVILNCFLIRLHRRHKFITHSHNPLFTFFSIFGTEILTVHDGLFYLNKSKKRKISIIFWLIEKLIYRRCEIVHFVSNYSKAQSLFGLGENFIIIPNTSHFEALSFHQNNISDDDPNIRVLIVRSFEERARFDLLLDVAESLRNLNYKFIVAGKGPLLNFYRKEVEERKIYNVTLLGYVPDDEIINLYSNCSLVLMIAEYGEGFGLPLIEGYLFNKPVIASDCCAIPEIIISKDYLFKNNVESIKAALFNINLNQTGFRDHYNANFSNSVIQSRFREIYSKF